MFASSDKYLLLFDLIFILIGERVFASTEQNLLLVILIPLLMEIAATPVLQMEDVMPNTMDAGSTNRAHASPSHSGEGVLECQGNVFRTATLRSIVARNEPHIPIKC